MGHDEQATATATPGSTKAGWRVREYMHDTGLGRSTINEAIRTRKVRSKKHGKARIILTSPAEYLASLPEG